jgi:hypothetical protein
MFGLFSRHVQVGTIINELVRGNERSAKEQVELVDLSFIVLNNIVKYLESLTVRLFFTPHHVGIGLKITLISITMHALEVFMTPIATFEKTPN